MKFLLIFVLAATLASAQLAPKAAPPANAQPSRLEPSDMNAPSGMNALWSQELPNMKSDLAELRSMLNVMASQESSLDLRNSGAFQTNRKMWQVVIARLEELTQRMDALERSRGSQVAHPHPEHP